MKLSELIFPGETVSPLPEDIEISGISRDSRKTEEGEAFFLLTPDESFARAAISRGASVIVSESEIKALPCTQIITSDVRRAYALACLRLRGNPQNRLRLCAVTGTNGKTTVTYMLSEILREAGYSTAVIGTLGAVIGDKTVNTGYTTPPSEVFADLLYQAAQQNIDFVITEASSHSLAQGRLSGLDFEVGVFTNFSHDHLDFHKTPDACAEAKASLFSHCENSVINFDDARSHEMAWAAKDVLWYYSVTDYDEDFYADSIITDKNGVSFNFCTCDKKAAIASSLFGMFTVLDMLAAASAAAVLGVKRKLIARALSGFKGVPGRMEIIKSKADFNVIVDFAHTPQAMKSVLSAARTFTEGKLICLFGCGGERDKSKRSEMGKIAGKFSDRIIITSDNPRSEKPSSIIYDILAGIPIGTDFTAIEDRACAIRFALDYAKNGDTVMLLGKGHENYIESASGKLPFSDKEETINILKEKGLW